jgi:hypothetical protein
VQPVLGTRISNTWRVRAGWLMRGGVCGHEQHTVERKLIERVARDRDMPEVRRIEGAAEDAER